MSDKPLIIDLFSGCGGFGLGAELAGFHTHTAVDIDSTLQSAYKLNFPLTNTITQDITTFTKETWQQLLNGQKIDGVIGGPPCQGFSRMGLGDENDPRRELLSAFFHQVNLINPSFFIMENVEGLMDAKNLPQLKKALALVDRKYTILDPIIIDASTCGAPTKRKRVIVIGYDKKRVKTLDKNNFLFNCSPVTVKDAISDLPGPIAQNKDTSDYGFAKYKKTINLSDYATSMRQSAPMGLGADYIIKKHANNEISGFFETIHAPEVAQRYKDTPQGKTDKISRSKKLAWDGLSPTLRAGTGTDKGSYQAVRPLHPEQGRVITVREAARLQGFPDWFVFHPTKWHSFRMIGNSVSPIVSQKILTVIYNHLIRTP